MLSERPEFPQLSHKILGTAPVIGTAMGNGIRESNEQGPGHGRSARAEAEGERLRSISELGGGWGGIRTHGELAPSPVFKTGSLNHSDTLP